MSPRPEDEAGAHEGRRLSSLYSYRILDTDRDESFDLLCRLAALVCDTPLATIKLVDAERVWTLAGFGPRQQQNFPRLHSLSNEVVATRSPVVVADASTDALLSDVTGVGEAPLVRAYAGVPLGGRDGLLLGALCVADQRARPFDAEQVTLLQGLAEQASALLELRRVRLLLLPLIPAAADARDLVGPNPATTDVVTGPAFRALIRLRAAVADTGPALRAAEMDAEVAALSRLSNRELDIVGRLAHGDRVPVIAETLFVSQSTVRNHLSSAFRKLGVSSQQELIDLLHGQTRRSRPA
jgi:GAF domain-containing protein